MPKRIEVTPAIKEAIVASVGSEIDFDNIAVFETVAVTSRPINKPGSIFHDAVIPRATLEQAAAQLNTGTFVPLHTLHMQGYELPVGRLFKGTVGTSQDGFDELHALFYVDPSEKELASKIENGTIEEVSVGLRPEKLVCSGCDFDYGLKSSEENLWTRTCDNGHVLGMGGYHLRLEGVKKFMETSLVSKGASDGAKILNQRKRLLASQFADLAASCNNPEHTTLFASPTLGEEIDMKEIEELQAGLAALTAKVGEQEAALVTAQTTITAQAEELTALKASAESTKALAEKSDALIALADGAEALTAKITGVEETVAKLSVTPAAPAASSHPFRLPLDGITNLRASAHDSAEKPVQGKGSAFKTKR